MGEYTALNHVQKKEKENRPEGADDEKRGLRKAGELFQLVQRALLTRSAMVTMSLV